MARSASAPSSRQAPAARHESSCRPAGASPLRSRLRSSRREPPWARRRRLAPAAQDRAERMLTIAPPPLPARTGAMKRVGARTGQARRRVSPVKAGVAVSPAMSRAGNDCVAVGAKLCDQGIRRNLVDHDRFETSRCRGVSSSSTARRGAQIPPLRLLGGVVFASTPTWPRTTSYAWSCAASRCRPGPSAAPIRAVSYRPPRSSAACQVPGPCAAGPSGPSPHPGHRRRGAARSGGTWKRSTFFRCRRPPGPRWAGAGGSRSRGLTPDRGVRLVRRHVARQVRT
jgi:hypothetical protein